MGIVSSAKKSCSATSAGWSGFQSPMGIVSSAKEFRRGRASLYESVSIPDGDSFLREEQGLLARKKYLKVFQSPMGIVSSAKEFQKRQ